MIRFIVSGALANSLAYPEMINTPCNVMHVSFCTFVLGCVDLLLAQVFCQLTCHQ